MRQIKFRGKRIDNGEWVYGGISDVIEDKVWIIQSRRHEFLNIYVYNTIEVDPETVGQYTGLKDKNGKEIYDGDILLDENKYPVGYIHELLNQTGVVTYNVELGGWYVVSKKGSMTLQNATSQYLLVIGNKHDNKDLLID